MHGLKYVLNTESYARMNAVTSPLSASNATLAPYADFYPGEFSRTYVGVTRRSLEGVLEGLRAGRIWLSHGGLVQELEVGAYGSGDAATLGGRLRVRRGSDVTVVISARLASRPNGGGENCLVPM